MVTADARCKQRDLHECTHDCICFWCRVSRKEPFETSVITFDDGIEFRLTPGQKRTLAKARANEKRGGR